MSSSDSSRAETPIPLDDQLSRRAMMRGSLVAGATAMGLGASAHGAAAQETVAIDYGSDIAHDSVLYADVTVDETDLSSMSALDYKDDDGEIQNLTDGYGVRVADDESDDDTVAAHNPLSAHLTDVEDGLFERIPRGVTDTDADDEEYDVMLLDADEWDETGGAMVSDDGQGISISGDDTDSARFEHADWQLDSDEPRKVVRLIADVVSLPAGATITITVESNGTNAVYEVVEGGDGGASTTIATAETNGLLYQSQIGDDYDNVDTINAIEVAISGATGVQLDVSYLDVELETELEVADQEVVETDDDGDDYIEIESVTQHGGGPLAFRSLSDFSLDSAMIEDLTYSTWQWGSDLSSANVMAAADESPSGYDRDHRVTWSHGHEVPAAFALSWDIGDLELEGGVSSGYIEAGYQTNVDLDDYEDIEDIRDQDTVDVTGSISVGRESRTTLTSTVLPDEPALVVVDIVTGEEGREDLTKDPQFAAAVGATGDEEGGFFSGVRGTIMALAAVVGSGLGIRELLSRRGA